MEVRLRYSLKNGRYLSEYNYLPEKQKEREKRMDDELKFIARKGFVVREILDEYMLVPMDTGNVHLSDGDMLPEFNGIIELNELALFLYNTLSSPKTFSELVEAVESEYDTVGQDVAGDINDFLDKGIKNQIIFIISRRKEEKTDEKL